MITVKFLKECAGVEPGTVKEWPDNHKGLVRSLIANGTVEVIEPVTEKTEEEPVTPKAVTQSPAKPKRVYRKK